MTKKPRLIAIAGILLPLIGGTGVEAQLKNLGPTLPVTAPPKLLLLVHQQIRFGSELAREKLEMASAAAYDRLNVPISWIDMQSITGAPEAVFFDPMNSYEDMDTDLAVFGQLFAEHPELSAQQEKIKTLVSSERTIVAVRRDDISYRAASIDLSKARFMRTLEVHLRPGHEGDFAEAFKILAGAYEKMDSDTPWVVYQVNAGSPSPCFFAFIPMHALRQNDDLLSRGPKLRESEGEDGSRRMLQIASAYYVSTESNVYAISPAMSHVSKEFAAANPDFWRKPVSATSKKSQDHIADAPAPKD
ncbi:MAG TPA: hypothetical protein VGI16_15725 [Candidatus Acidoferrum sp.]|jgi:hypothetical protein